MMKMCVRVGVGLLVSAGILMGGCSHRRGVGMDAGAAFADPISRSSVRERALGQLLESAMGESALLRANAIEGMQQAPSRAEDLVLAGLTDENLGVRFTAAMTAGKLRMKRAVGALRSVERDPSMMVRAGVVYALVSIGAETDQSLLGTMLGSGDIRERAQAAFVLGEIGNASAIPMLREAAQRTPPRAPLSQIKLLRLQIAEALVKLGHESAIETVRAALYPARPEDLEATALAVQVIGQVADRRSVDQLIYLTARTGKRRMPAEVRLAAASALAELGLGQGAFLADEFFEDKSATLRAQAAHVYGLTEGAGNLAKLDELLRDDSEMVRVAAAAGALRILDREVASVDSWGR